MKHTPRLFIAFLLFTAVPAVNGTPVDSSLTQQLARCAALGNDRQRLACFDELTRHASLNTDQSRARHPAQPPAEFLDSRLVAEAWKAEYDLTVRGFVKLISQAVMDNRQQVTVQGWSRDKQDYVLNITMRTPVQVHFLPRKSTSDSTPMSLLREVTMDGRTIGAGQFILIIAAMVPDK